MTDPPAPAPKKPVVLVRPDELIAGSLREQARALMRWAVDLRNAETAGDWKKVAEVRGDIAACSQSVALFAADLEVRARAPR